MPTVQPFNRSTVQLHSFVVLALLSISCGCNGLISAAANDPEKVTVTAGLPIIDAGVVLVDRPFYLCIPLSRIGLPPDEQIVSLRSSCECIRLQLVSFCENSNQTAAPAILLESVMPNAAEVRTPATEATPARLRIDVEAKLSDGRTHRFVVNLVESKLVNEIERRDVDG